MSHKCPTCSCPLTPGNTGTRTAWCAVCNHEVVLPSPAGPAPQLTSFYPWPTQHRHTHTVDGLAKVLNDVTHELGRAEAKYPLWPDDYLHAVAIMNEEAGEATKACIDMIFHRQDVGRYREELVQTAAMAIRALLDLDARLKTK